METAKEILSNVEDFIKMSQVAKSFFGRDRTWLYHKLNEDVVNGSQYSFSASELAQLADGLADISKRIKQAERGLRKLQKDKEREAGRHYTISNPFDHPLFAEWLKLLPTEKRWLEPFAGACDIPRLIEEIGLKVYWDCFDIVRTTTHHDIIRFTRRDTISNFPTGYQVCVTNPPYLHRNSATRRGLPYPETCYDDIYKHCLSLMLTNCEYVAAIIPDSFISSGLFRGRLYGVISLTIQMFNTTDCPVCLALFVPKCTSDFQIWHGERYLGNYNELAAHNLSDYSCNIDWRFNDPDGAIIVRCVDSKRSADICFLRSEVDDITVKRSSRHIVKIGGLPKSIDLDKFIGLCNSILYEYRQQTQDCFLTSFGGLRKDGCYRKRISFHVIRRILAKAMYMSDNKTNI